MTVKDFGTRVVKRSRTPLVFSAVAVVGALAALMFTVIDLARFEHDNAIKRAPTPVQRTRYAPAARAEWRQVRTHLETRLNQTLPLELGAVWATRSGQVCGLVNGRGSFGGLTAMARFYTVDQRPVFHQDVDHIAFQKAWFECRRDQYVMLHEGTTEPGFCGTELGKRRCYAVKNGVRVE
ncbi:hypothetical protein B7G68_04855 [Caulobacter segnis]|uniref:Uncharacterized protein n=2 Tax=Caulobacter segnis TaxID=88688 RepID=D5VF35_CAUST|nr:hypothetical protein [Caulobacter segnis]ADG09453.1 conserved hypothetical protein [Caulobacter segnis ATCC 21756]AVQ01249.1 hypothetical protein B7G68_04855 [Caulobacter segnis]